MSVILQVNELRKSFPSAANPMVKAVNGISFSIPKGICFGLLGPNGAGKTTTIEMIEGLCQPNSGEIRYNGNNLAKHQHHKQFKKEAGIQFQETALPDYLTVVETLKLFASFYPRHLAIDEVITLCDLGEFLNQLSTRLSGGQRQRLLLALALINDPQLVFLDEPTTGLDPQSRRRFWHLIERIKGQGKTILLTTHYMDEAEYLCDDLVIMDHGAIIDQGSPKALLAKHFQHVKIRLDKEVLENTPFASDAQIKRDDEHAYIYTSSVEQTITQLIEQQVPLNSLSVQNPTLEDLFIKLTGHQLRS
jgi:ABC-2 type transport system ATP-binding protein